MITHIRSRPRLDVLQNDVGSRTGRWGKWVYFCLLIAFASLLLNYLFGSMLFLRAQGIVLRPELVIAAPFEAQIREINVRPGERVAAGTRIARLESATMMRSISDLASQFSNLRTRIAQLEGRRSIVKQVLPIAQRVEKESKAHFQRVRSLASAGYSNTAHLQETSVAYHNAASKRISLAAELASLQREIEENQRTLREVQSAYDRLRRIYADGEIVAPVNGIVGPTVASNGEVILTGKPLLKIYNGKSYILAYLPNDYQFSVERGSKVFVDSGGENAVAVIEDILPVADRLPSEFRAQIRATPRSRLMRVNTIGTSKFALRQKVLITSCYVNPCVSLLKHGARWYYAFANEVSPYILSLLDQLKAAMNVPASALERVATSQNTTTLSAQPPEEASETVRTPRSVRRKQACTHRSSNEFACSTSASNGVSGASCSQQDASIGDQCNRLRWSFWAHRK
ncbi:MAG: HlyD family efflux transporter periplasmic adaptor subunit [Hyphomicrobiaceae bacterium]